MERTIPPPPLDRLYNGRGELTQMPVKAPVRREFLAWVASLLPAGETLTEPEANAVLRQVDDDVATLRRYLVDDGLLERPEPGAYRRPADD